MIAAPPPAAEVRATPGWLSAEELTLLTAICDTLFPTLVPPAGSPPDVAAYYRRSASDLHLAEHLADRLAGQGALVQADIRRFLSLFRAPPVSLALAGMARPFTELPPERRERFLLALANSPVGPFRQGYQGIKRLSGLLFFSLPDTTGDNPNWPVLGYIPPQPEPPRATTPLVPATVTADCTLEADVVVVGSGAGGGVVAGELARAGKRVVVLEQGGYNHEGTFTMREHQAMSGLFLNQGALATSDLGVVLMAGGTLGGGTVVNWMTAFRTPDYVLDEWDTVSGLPGCFSDGTLDASFAAVEHRLRVNRDHSQHNQQNHHLLAGAQALGYSAGAVPRNAVGCDERCGACTFGCRFGCNQSTLKTYVQDAYDHRARILVQAEAERVLLERGRAVGVVARVQRADGGWAQVTVRAAAVVLAAGAIQTPLLLLRSGVQNPAIGRHLHLHPSAISVGVYPHPVHAWEGVMQSAYSDAFARLDASYGYTLEVAPTHPGLFGLATPWYDARTYRDEMRRIAHLSSVMVLLRDRGAGRVSFNRDGTARISYAVSAYDRAHLLHGLRQGTRIHFAAGAERVISLQNRPTDMQRAADTAEHARRLRTFDRQIARRGLGPNQILLFSAHQMGTCRIGADRRDAVIDAQHQVYGVAGLFVCDSSVFPNACGINPMLTIMALAHRASGAIRHTLA